MPPAVVAAVIAAAGKVGGAALSSSGQKGAAATSAEGSLEAAKIQAQTSADALAQAKQIWEQQRADLAPYRNFGAGAMQGLGYLSGIVPSQYDTTLPTTTTTPTTPTTTSTTPTLPTFPDLVNAGNQQVNMKNVMNQTLNRLQQTQLQYGMPITGLTQSQIDAMKNVGIDLTQPLNSRQLGVLFGPTSQPSQAAQTQYNQQLNAQAAANRQRLGVSASMGPLTPQQLLDQSNPLNTGT